MFTSWPIRSAFCFFFWSQWMTNCFSTHYASASKQQLGANEFGDFRLNDRQIIEQLLKTYRLPDPSLNISVGVSLFVERILEEANEDLCHLQLLITQKWMEGKLNYEHIRESPASVRLRSIDYIYNPALVIENALSVLPVGKSVITVFSNGIVEYVQRIQLLVQANTNLRTFPFEVRDCPFHFSNDDGRAVWSRLLSVETSENAQKGLGEWKLVGTRQPEVRTLQVLMRRSIHQFVITLFLPSLGLLLVSWFSSWFYFAEDRRRLYSNITCSIGIILVILANQYKTPQTGFLKAIDIWCLAVTTTVFLNCLCVIISGSWATRVAHRQHRMAVQRSSYDPESEKARWIPETPYYSQLGFDPNITAISVCKCCISSLTSLGITIGFFSFGVYFGLNFVFPYYQKQNWVV